MKNPRLNKRRCLTTFVAICALSMLTGFRSFAQGQQDSTTANGTTPARCLGSQLSLREAEGEADMGGKRYGNFVFTNTSSSACTLTGYPRFLLLNKSGRSLRGVRVRYEDGFVSGDSNRAQSGDAPQRVTLEPGQTAWFQIFYNDGMALGPPKRFPVSAKVRVVAPGTNRVFILRSQIRACCGVQVSSVRGGLPR